MISFGWRGRRVAGLTGRHFVGAERSIAFRICLSVLFVQLFVTTLITGLDVARNTEEHVLSQLCHVDWLIALVDDIRVALFTSFGVNNFVGAHALV